MKGRNYLGILVVAAALSGTAIAAERNAAAPASTTCSGALARIEKRHHRFHPVSIRKAIEDGFSGFGVALSSTGIPQASCPGPGSSEFRAGVPVAQPVDERIRDSHRG